MIALEKAVAVLMQDRPCVMVSVKAAGKSAEAMLGKWMLVDRENRIGSLGQDRIEAQALVRARRLLHAAGPDHRELMEIAAAPGSPEGGDATVTLLLEAMQPAAGGWIDAWRRAARDLVGRSMPKRPATAERPGGAAE